MGRHPIPRPCAVRMSLPLSFWFRRTMGISLNHPFIRNVRRPSKLLIGTRISGAPKVCICLVSRRNETVIAHPCGLHSKIRFLTILNSSAHPRHPFSAQRAISRNSVLRTQLSHDSGPRAKRSVFIPAAFSFRTDTPFRSCPIPRAFVPIGINPP